MYPRGLWLGHHAIAHHEMIVSSDGHAQTLVDLLILTSCLKSFLCVNSVLFYFPVLRQFTHRLFPYTQRVASINH